MLLSSSFTLSIIQWNLIKFSVDIGIFNAVEGFLGIGSGSTKRWTEIPEGVWSFKIRISPSSSWKYICSNDSEIFAVLLIAFSSNLP